MQAIRIISRCCADWLLFIVGISLHHLFDETEKVDNNKYLRHFVIVFRLMSIYYVKIHGQITDAMKVFFWISRCDVLSKGCRQWESKDSLYRAAAVRLALLRNELIFFNHFKWILKLGMYNILILWCLRIVLILKSCKYQILWWSGNKF